MYLKKVTITGIDSDTEISKIIQLSEEFPFVEWGILVSTSRTGTNRYPSFDYIDAILCELNNCMVSLHFCGELSRRILYGDSDFFYGTKFMSFLKNASRIQINCNLRIMKEKDPKFSINTSFMKELIRLYGTRIIITENKSNYDAWKCLLKDFVPDVLFDGSGGSGREMKNIKAPIAGIFCGYAGGISNLNIKYVLENLDFHIENGIIWVDMESGVRTNHNHLDLKKVREVLESSKKYTLYK